MFRLIPLAFGVLTSSAVISGAPVRFAKRQSSNSTWPAGQSNVTDCQPTSGASSNTTTASPLPPSVNSSSGVYGYGVDVSNTWYPAFPGTGTPMNSTGTYTCVATLYPADDTSSSYPPVSHNIPVYPYPYPPPASNVTMNPAPASTNSSSESWNTTSTYTPGAYPYVANITWTYGSASYSGSVTCGPVAPVSSGLPPYVNASSTYGAAGTASSSWNTTSNSTSTASEPSATGSPSAASSDYGSGDDVASWADGAASSTTDDTSGEDSTWRSRDVDDDGDDSELEQLTEEIEDEEEEEWLESESNATEESIIDNIV